MRKRKQKAPKIPKAPDPIAMGVQPNPKARRLGMSAIKNATKTAAQDANLKNNPLNAIKNTILSSANLDSSVAIPRKTHANTPFNVNSIQSYPELLAALEAQAVQITLGANIIAPDNILINHDVAINFNGYNIISEEANPGARVLDIRSGEVTLTGKGKVFAMGARSVAIRVFGAISIGMPSYTTLTIDDGISLFAPDSYGILVSPNLGVAYGLTINLSGEIIARDGIGLSSHIRGRDTNLPTINIRSGARITADEIHGSALEAAGYAVWNIGAAKLTGATGALLKSGQIDFSHAEVIATGSAYPERPVTKPLSSTDATKSPEVVYPEDAAKDSQKDPQEDPIPQNAAIRIVSAAKHDLNITVEGGSYLGEKSFAVAGDPSSLESFVIKGGDFSGALDVLHYAIETDLDIEEGSFSLHPALHLKALKPEIVLLPEPEPEPYPKEIIEAQRPVPVSDPDPVAEKPLQKLPMPPTYNEAECAEKIAMQNALADAIAEMKNLKSSDYEVGFVDLEAAIRSAEQLLASKIITLPAIRDASAKLLAAFDNLEERDEFSLTDDELDELFYHGAVLDELASDIKNDAKNNAKADAKTDVKNIKTDQKPAQNQNPAPNIQQQPQTTQPVQAPAVAPQPPIAPSVAPAPSQGLNFSALATLISQISALNPTDYTPDTYNILLSELTRIKPLLADATQAQIDTAAQNLAILLSKLVPLRPRIPLQTPTSAPAQPTFFASCIIDEALPVRHWSTGVTSIDESDPHLCLAAPAPKFLRKKLSLRFSPVSNFFKSFSAGFRAGLDAYQKTRRIAKN